MMRLMSCVFRWLAIFFLAVSMLACGGGGGGGGGGGDGGRSDPGRSFDYSGVSTQAELDAGNVEALAVGSYAGSLAGSVSIGSSMTQRTLTPGDINQYQGQRMLQAIKTSARQVDYAAATLASAGTASGLGTNTVYGSCGGSLRISIDVNESTGNFTGTFIYDGYCNSGVSVTGSGQLDGIVNLSSNQLQRIRLSFSLLSITEPQGAYDLAGQIEMLFNADESETARMDVLLREGDGGKVYWLYDYVVTTTYTGVNADIDIAGRYYDPDHGYVDLRTETPVRYRSSDDWPLQGVLVLTGADGAWVRLSFGGPGYCRLEADFDGAPGVDWMDDYWFVSGIDNSPPVANAGPDRTVVPDVAVVLDGSASYDPEDHAIFFSWSFVSCPATGCPTLDNLNPYISTTSFTPTATGRYILQLSVYDGQLSSPLDRVVIDVVAGVPAEPDLMSRQWTYGIFGNRIGSSGIQAADIDKDGAIEIVAGASAFDFGSNKFWYIVRYTDSGEYRQVWFSPVYRSTIQRIVTADKDGDGIHEIYVGLADGNIRIYDGLTLDQVGTLATGAGLSAMVIGDTDGDGELEIVCSDGSDLRVYAAGTLDLLWSSSNWGGQALAIGNVDGDASPEIVATTNNGHGYVVNGADQTLQWDYLNGFGQLVETGDIDGDGMEEIVGAAAWYRIMTFDADAKTPGAEISTDMDIDALRVADTDGDDLPEILYGDRQRSAVYCHDGSTLELRWSVNNLNSGVGDIALGDVDGDGALEVIWAAGGQSTGEDHLFVAGIPDGTIEWYNVHLDGPLNAVDVGDVDDDGEDEIVMVSFESNSGYDEGVIHIFDARTHALEWRSTDLPGITSYSGVHAVKIGDVDDDGASEFVIATSDLFGGVIQVYGGTTRSPERTSIEYAGVVFTNILIEDVDGDGETEIVAGQKVLNIAASAAHIVVFNGATAMEEWQSDALGAASTVEDIVIADMDNDENLEIVVSTGSVTHQMDWLEAMPATALAVNDIDKDGDVEILAGRTTGEVAVYGGATFELESTPYPAPSQAITALLVDDVNNDGADELIIGGDAGLMAFDTGAGELLWRSGVLGEDLGRYNQLVSCDPDGDGLRDLVVGSGVALYQFE